MLYNYSVTNATRLCLQTLLQSVCIVYRVILTPAMQVLLLRLSTHGATTLKAACELHLFAVYRQAVSALNLTVK
jgi:hypothetical protein